LKRKKVCLEDILLPKLFEIAVEHEESDINGKKVCNRKAMKLIRGYCKGSIQFIREYWGFYTETRKKDFYLMLFMQDELDYKECYSLYMSKQVGGFILPGVDRKKHAGIKCLVKEKIPLAIVCSRLDNICSFDCDNVRGGYLATKHLIKKR